jgi:predicted aspartyl protease
MALDTGAVTTLIDTKPLQTLGYGPWDGMPRVRIVTAGDIKDAVQARIQTVAALGYEKHDFPVLILPLPKASGVDGLLGLNYLRERKLTLDFLKGEIIVE